jgi:hypothetical protein
MKNPKRLADLIKNAISENLLSCLDSKDPDVINHMKTFVTTVKEKLLYLIGSPDFGSIPAIFFCESLTEENKALVEADCQNFLVRLLA